MMVLLKPWFPEQFKVIICDWSSSMMVHHNQWFPEQFKVNSHDWPTSTMVTNGSLDSSKLSAKTGHPLWWFHHNQWFLEQCKVISHARSSSLMVLLKPMVPWTVQSYQPRLVVLFDGPIKTNGSLNSSKLSAMTGRPLWLFHHNQDSVIINGSLNSSKISVMNGRPLW